MASKTWEDLFLRILLHSLNSEKQIEQTRSKLSISLVNCNSSPKILFRSIDVNQKGYLNYNDFKNFNNSFETVILRQLINFYDRKDKFYLDFKEFLNLTTDGAHFASFAEGMKGNKSYQQCSEETFSLLNELIILELQFLKGFYQLVNQLKQEKDFSTYEAFLLLDGKNKKFIDLESLFWYFNTRHNFELSEKLLTMLLFRMDKDKDGVISYKEFQELFYFSINTKEESSLQHLEFNEYQNNEEEKDKKERIRNIKKTPFSNHNNNTLKDEYSREEKSIYPKQQRYEEEDNHYNNFDDNDLEEDHPQALINIKKSLNKPIKNITSKPKKQEDKEILNYDEYYNTRDNIHLNEMKIQTQPQITVHSSRPIEAETNLQKVKEKYTFDNLSPIREEEFLITQISKETKATKETKETKEVKVEKKENNDEYYKLQEVNRLLHNKLSKLQDNLKNEFKQEKEDELIYYTQKSEEKLEDIIEEDKTYYKKINYHSKPIKSKKVIDKISKAEYTNTNTNDHNQNEELTIKNYSQINLKNKKEINSLLKELDDYKQSLYHKNEDPTKLNQKKLVNDITWLKEHGKNIPNYIFNIEKIDVKANLIINYLMKTLQLDNSLVQMKTELSEKSDFNLDLLFSSFDLQEQEKINITDFQEVLCDLNLFPTLNDLKFIFKKFDKDGDGRLNRQEFYEMFEVQKSDYLGRSKNFIEKSFDCAISLETKELLTTYISLLIQVEKEIEKIKVNLNSEKDFSSIEIFELIKNSNIDKYTENINGISKEMVILLNLVLQFSEL